MAEGSYVYIYGILLAFGCYRVLGGCDKVAMNGKENNMDFSEAIKWLDDNDYNWSFRSRWDSVFGEAWNDTTTYSATGANPLATVIDLIVQIEADRTDPA